MNLGRQGWKEEWYQVAATPAAALVAMQNVSDARLALLNPLVSIDQLKVSDVTILGDSLPDYTWQTKRAAANAALKRDQTTSSLLARAFSVVAAGGGGTLQYQRPVELSGLPDDWLTYDVNGAPGIPGAAGCPPAFLTAWQNWVAKMIANQFCIRALDKSQPLKPIKGFAVNPFTAVGGVSQGKILVYCPGHGLNATNAEGQTSYRIKGAKFVTTFTDLKGLGPLDNHGKSLINRVHFWQDITQQVPVGGGAPVYPTINGNVISPTDWLQLAYDLPTGFGLLVYVGGGTVQQRLHTYQAVTSMVPERFGSRDRGRAYFVPRGRARVRAR